jgi:hypothetical protein
VDGTGKRELLSSPIGVSVGEGELRNLFEGEELRIMLFILKVDFCTETFGKDFDFACLVFRLHS